MIQAIAHLKSITPYSQSKHYDKNMVPKLQSGKESDSDYEHRTWRNRLHVTEDGHVYVPPTHFKKCLSVAAAYNPVKIPGVGNTKYTKHFVSGVRCSKDSGLSNLGRVTKSSLLRTKLLAKRYLRST